MKIGIGSYTFTWAIGVPGYGLENPMSVFELIERTFQLKAQVVQLADNIELERFSKAELNDIASYASHRGLDIEIGAKGLTGNRLDTYISIAKVFNSRILRFVIDDVGYTPSVEEVINNIRPFLARLESDGIKLAIENHDRLKCKEFVHIINKCDSPNVGICLDTVNSLGVPEGTEQVIEELLPYTLNLHIKDFVIERLKHKMGFKVEGRPAGKGMLNVESLLGKLKEKGRCESAILELWTPFGPDIKTTIERENSWAVESMGYLNQLSFFEI